MKRRIGVRVQRPLSPRLADRSTHPESAVNRMSERIIYLNGVRVDEENARVSILDRGFQFGDSVYEVIRCYNGVPFLLEGHLDRLGRSLGELYIPWPQQRAEIAKLCIQAARECGPDPSILYLQVTRGVADRAYSPPSDLKPTFVLYCQPYCGRDCSAYTSGISVAILPDIRWHRCDIKTTSLVASVLQKMRAAAAGAEDVLVDREGLGVVESGSGNLFVVKNGIITTAPEGRYILSGISRQLVLRLADEMSIPVILAYPSRADVFGADEAFITSTTAEVMPVTRVDSHLIGRGVPGPITTALISAFRAEVTRSTGYSYER